MLPSRSLRTPGHSSLFVPFLNLHDPLSVPNGSAVANQRMNSNKTKRLKNQRGSSKCKTGPHQACTP